MYYILFRLAPCTILTLPYIIYAVIELFIMKQL